MEHICSFEECSLPLTRGVRVVQMLRGTVYGNYITPAFSEVLAEWHQECFHEFRLRAQNAPYACQQCQHPIGHGEPVFCFVIGEETDEYHSVAESRGYEIYSVRHVRCGAATDGRTGVTNSN